MTSVPAAASWRMAASQMAAISASTSKPGVGAQITRDGADTSSSEPAHGAWGGGRENRSVGSGPTHTSSAKSTSAIRRAIGPLTVQRPDPGGVGPPFGTRPCEVLMPDIPHTAEGMRIDPPPSLPVASGTMPEAIAAADPPDEPPGDRSVFHGLRVGPNVGLVVSPWNPTSGVVV